MKPDKEILDMVVGGVSIREMTAITFLQLIARKLNGVSTYSATTQELLAIVSHAPMGNRMPDEEKVRLIKKMESIGITL